MVEIGEWVLVFSPGRRNSDGRRSWVERTLESASLAGVPVDIEDVPVDVVVAGEDLAVDAWVSRGRDSRFPD